MMIAWHQVKVLVTGATGFLGGVVARQLVESGAHVRALARRPNRDHYIRDLPNLEVVMGDLTNAERMREVTHGCDYVFHVGAALSGDLDAQRRVNQEGTRNIATAAALAGVRRFVHISSIAVYGYKVRGDVTEDTSPEPGADPYAITKLEAEHALMQVAVVHDLAYSIIRPGMIYGPRSGMWTRFAFKVARRKPTLFIGSGRGTAYPVHVHDVTDLALTVAQHPAANRQIFNCTPDPSPTFRDYLSAYAALLDTQGSAHRWVGIPPALLRPAVGMMALFAPQYSRTRDLPDLLSFMQQHITFKMDKAQDLLNWQPKISLGEGVQSCVPYLQEKGLLP